MGRCISVLAVAAVCAPVFGQGAQRTWTEHVAPIVFRSCAGCHRQGEVAPFPLLTYRDVKKRARNLLRVMAERIMPPWHPEPGYGSFRHELRLTDAEIATFRAWVRNGMPEGNRSLLPARPRFANGWQLGEPDLVVSTSGAFPVPASGPDIYRSFALRVDLPADKWLTAIEVRPSARAVLHHVLVFVDEHRVARDRDGQGGRPGFHGMDLEGAPQIAVWAVGGMPAHLPNGLAFRLPRHSDLVLQSHLHPSGKPELEQTTIGLHFADEPPKRSLAMIVTPPFYGFTAGLDIPAGDADFCLRDSFELPCAVDAVSVGGHAHLLCRSLRLHATVPDGDDVPLLHIPKWDFDWQNRYTFRDLVRLPQGAVLHAELRYDNSDDNPDNPHSPPRRVRWGVQTTDEMGGIGLLVTPADERDHERLRRAIEAYKSKSLAAVAGDMLARDFRRLDQNGDARLTATEMPRRLRRFFEQLDQNGDGAVSLAEAKMLPRLGQRVR